MCIRSARRVGVSQSVGIAGGYKSTVFNLQFSDPCYYHPSVSSASQCEKKPDVPKLTASASRPNFVNIKSDPHACLIFRVCWSVRNFGVIVL